MVDWAISDAGQAIAAWMSDVLSFLAIILAISVALFEQNRANKDRLNELARERERQEKIQAERLAEEITLIKNFVDLISDAEYLLDQIYKDVSHTSYVDWGKSSDFPRSLVPYREALRDLKALWRGSSSTSLHLSAVVILIGELVEGPGGDAPSGPRVTGYMGSRIQQLRNTKDKLSALK